ncbi:very-long-chain (3R)-3-hydroxyacyl-CoA dehydratase isoform X2 [Cylas formicarius]|uniref:very-long-chain (3R)-3-hydroxyacyl-CoA dehydratase isoform X2 n=1 Tax=Cylas formicarius TaxID=197179 RepID=UPI002958C11C|nr:very-long-chain (3R)-3-hydroxyacyl-CoA dehydratase isoform X2 [Cylas formicarius]
MSVLSPFVYWAQNEEHIFLKVDLKDTKNPYVKCNDRNIDFKANGTGAQGVNNYNFNLSLFENIQTAVCEAWWPRLMSTPQKPSWLKIDFDKWQTEDDLLDELNDVRHDYPDLYNMLQKQEMGYIREDFKRVYLSIYNLFMFVGYMYILSVLCMRYIKDGPNFFPETYDTIGKAMCFIQLLQVLEVMHPLFGYVKGGIMMPFMQVVGRLFVLFAMVECEPRIQKMPVVFYLLLVWSSIEVIRYPYYMTQLINKEQYLLTWLRYSAWIILYPLGFVCEAMIIFRNMIYVHSSHKWSVTMPNSLNFTFDFLLFLRIYLLLVLFPGIYTLMRHMYNARIKKLGGKEPFLKNISKKFI